MSREPRETERCFLAALFTLFVLTHGAMHAGEPHGEFRVAFGDAAALSPLPAEITACEDSAGLELCYTFRPEVDPKGRISGTVEIEMEGELGGTPVAATITGPFSGSIRGRSGDGTLPLSRVKLVVKNSGNLSTGGEQRDYSFKARFRGVLLHSNTKHELTVSRKLKIDGVGSSRERGSFLYNAAEGELAWNVPLSLSTEGRAVQGMAAPFYRGTALGEYTIQGTYSEKDQVSSFRLRPDDTLRGTVLQVKNLRLHPDGTATFEARYRLLGHRGRVSSESGSVEWRPRVSEGNPADPIDITGQLPYEGRAETEAGSHYLVTGLTPGGSYILGFGGITEGKFYFSILEEGSGVDDWLCRSGNINYGNVCGFVANAQGRAIISAIPWNPLAPARFTLFLDSVDPAGRINEGSAAEPVDLTGSLPYPGTVWLGKSYYRIGQLTPGAPYTATLSDFTFDDARDKLTLQLFGPGLHLEPPRRDCQLFWGELAKSPSLQCASRADDDGAIHLEVWGVSVTKNGASYTVSVAPGGPAKEGYRQAPLDIGDRLPWEGAVGPRHDDSHYRIGRLDPRRSYTVRLSDRSTRLRLAVFADATFQDHLCSAGSNRLSDDLICEVEPRGDALYLRVSSEDSPSAFTLHLE